MTIEQQVMIVIDALFIVVGLVGLRRWSARPRP